MNAQTLNCYSCGAAVTRDVPNCQHCGARLASLSCPACFGMMFQGAKFCPHCGCAATQWEAGDSRQPCPACQVSMLRGTLRDVPLHECPKCYGLWLDTATFERVCRDTEQQSAILGSAQLLGTNPIGTVRYVRCPQCRDLMHRMNFARCSGVIVDVCRAHGTWFEIHELQRIVQFIRAGGLEQSRHREKADLAEERRRLQALRQESTQSSGLPHSRSTSHGDNLVWEVVKAAGDIFFTWIRH